MIFRELFVPGAAGYLSNSLAAAWLPKSKVKFVFYAFASVLLVAAGLSIWFVLPFAERIGELTFSVVGGQLTILAGVVGAYVFARAHLYEKPDVDVSTFDFRGMEFYLECPICGGPATEVEPANFDGKVITCSACEPNGFEVAGGYLEKLQALPQEDRNRVLRKAREFSAPGQRPAINSRTF